MRIIRDFSSLPTTYKGAVIALGNFDGVHLGHQAIVRACIDRAKALAVPAAVMTFEPHPREFFARGGDRLRIASFRDKAEMLRELGIDLLFLGRFNARFAARTAESFVEDILHGALAAKHIVTGQNFAFGSNRRGNTAFLAAEAQRLGFGFTACQPVYDAGGALISSSAIRQALSQGDMAKAAALLGAPYRISGRVRQGEKRGRNLGFPTANLSLDTLFKPRFGIYAVRLTVGADRYDGVASIGINPTFGVAKPLLEVHAFAMDRTLYGQHVAVEVIAFLREEKRFDTHEALAARIAADCVQAKNILTAE